MRFTIYFLPGLERAARGPLSETKSVPCAGPSPLVIKTLDAARFIPGPEEIIYLSSEQVKSVELVICRYQTKGMNLFNL